MHAERQTVAVTCDASGAATSYSTNVTGRLLTVRVESALASTADLTFTSEATGETSLTLTNLAASATYYPRVQVHDETGAGATLDGTRKMREPVLLVNDRVKIVVAQGGNGGTANVVIFVG